MPRSKRQAALLAECPRATCGRRKGMPGFSDNPRRQSTPTFDPFGGDMCISSAYMEFGVDESHS